MKERLKGLPVPILATMVGAITLSNVYQGLGFDLVRHLTMIAGTLVAIAYLCKILLYPNVCKNEYKNTVPASLYAGLTMLIMLLCSYYVTWAPAASRIVLIAAVCIHAVHILVFLINNVFRGVNPDTFVPSWFVTFNGIMVSTVVGAKMLPPMMKTAVLYWGLGIYFVTIICLIWRLASRKVNTPILHTKAVVLAPCSLCLVSYLNVSAAPNFNMVLLLSGCVLLSLIYIIWNLPAFFSVPFGPGFAGMTFPMAIGLVASGRAAAYFSAQGVDILGNFMKQIQGIQLYLTTAIIALVLFNFLRMLFPSMKKSL